MGSNNQTSSKSRRHHEDGTHFTTADPASQPAAQPPSRPAAPSVQYTWRDKLHFFSIADNNLNFVTRIFLGKFDGTRVTTVSTYCLYKQIDQATLDNLAQICKEGKRLSKSSPARHVTFDGVEYVVREKDPQDAPGYEFTFVCAKPIIWRLGEKVIYGYLTKKGYLVLGFGPSSKDLHDAEPGEVPRRVRKLIERLGV